MTGHDITSSLRDCAICPRRCHADRVAGRLGWCRSGAGVSIGSICLHRGEEPVIGGPDGICNVFFARCNLQCLYCQNWQISRNDGPIEATEMTVAEAVQRIRAVLAGGARRVGFVSPSHCIPQMMEIMNGLESAECRMQNAECRVEQRPRTTTTDMPGNAAPDALQAGANQKSDIRNQNSEIGSFRRPIFVMNTNAYDSVETLRALEGRMDAYLPDLKYMDSALAGRLSGAADYPQVATAALREMFRQKGARVWLAADGAIESGMVVRHLVLPGHVENSKACLRFLAEELSPSIHLSLLSQYRPTPAVAGDDDLGRALRPEEYEEVLDEMDRLGFHNGYTQQLSSAEYYNPDFREERPFGE